MVSDFNTKINPDALHKLARIARNQVFEPFEGVQSLERMKRARTGLEKGMEGMGRAKDWVKERLVLAADAAMPASKPQSPPGALKTHLKNLGAKAQRVAGHAKAKGQSAQEALWNKTAEYAEKAFELVVYENSAAWILPKARHCLDRPDLVSMTQIQELSEQERAQLIQALYPYASPKLSKALHGFDVTLNLLLGAVVVSNLPGTGLLVSAVNLVKTMVKLANRIKIMAAIYGWQVQSPEALFQVAGEILASMEDFDENLQHQPLSPLILAKLFQAPEEERRGGFDALIKQAFKKEAYIAIPGVGMISLGKIQLDDHKMDLLVLSLMRDYYELQDLQQQFGAELILEKVALLAKIFHELKKRRFFAEYRKALEKRQELGTNMDLWGKVKGQLAGDPLLPQIQSELLRITLEIYQHLPEPTLSPERLAELVEECIQAQGL